MRTPEHRPWWTAGSRTIAGSSSPLERFPWPASTARRAGRRCLKLFQLAGQKPGQPHYSSINIEHADGCAVAVLAVDVVLVHQRVNQDSACPEQRQSPGGSAGEKLYAGTRAAFQSVGTILSGTGPTPVTDERPGLVHASPDAAQKRRALRRNTLMTPQTVWMPAVDWLESTAPTRDHLDGTLRHPQPTAGVRLAYSRVVLVSRACCTRA